MRSTCPMADGGASEPRAKSNESSKEFERCQASCQGKSKSGKVSEQVGKSKASTPKARVNVKCTGGKHK